MSWKDYIIAAWKSGNRWVAFNVNDICTQKAKCFTSAVKADQYCSSKNNLSSNWQFDHLGNLKTYINPPSKNQIDWNDLTDQINQFKILTITKDQSLLSQLASGLYCLVKMKKPYLPIAAFKRYEVVEICNDNSCHKKLYNKYLEAFIDFNNRSILKETKTIHLYGLNDDNNETISDLLFTISNQSDLGLFKSNFIATCDPTQLVMKDIKIYLRYLSTRKQICFYDEFARKCNWRNLSINFNPNNVYVLKSNIIKFQLS